MSHLHLGALGAGGLDLGAIAFFGFVIAQLLAVILLRNLDGEARETRGPRPRISESAAGDAPSATGAHPALWAPLAVAGEGGKGR